MSSKPNQKTPQFARRLQELRRAAGKNQQDIADAMGVAQSHVSRMENGTAQPTPEQVDALARSLGMSRWAIVGGTELASENPGECIVAIEPDAPVKWLLYFASALTGLDDGARTALFADASIVRAVCEEKNGYLYEPVHYTDPVRNRDISSQDVYVTDRAQVSRSHAVLLYARYPSFGAGQELEIALAAGLPIVLLKPRTADVSRMVRGTFARLHVVEFDSPDDLRTALGATLTTVINDLALIQRVQDVDLGRRVRERRESLQLSIATVAQAVGLAEHAVSRLERGYFHSISITTLRRLAKVLRTSTCMLVDGVAPRLEDTDEAVRKSMENLRRVAQANNFTYAAMQALTDEYQREYQQARLAVAEARAEPVSEREWVERHRALQTNGARTQAQLFDE